MRGRFIAAEGDHLTLLNVLRAYEASGRDATWCRDHYVNRRSLMKALVRGTHCLCFGLSCLLACLLLGSVLFVHLCYSSHVP